MRPGTMIRTAQAILTGRPLVLFHKPTGRCDCRCRFCDSWIHQPSSDDTLPSERILELLREARAAGMTTYTVWGGEPLLVAALPLWLRAARELGIMTVVCTSGFRLAERAAEIGPHLDRLLLSLEAVGERQDRLRGTPGLFARLCAGLTELKKFSKAQITLWSNLTRDNAAEALPIARFARERGIEVEFFPAAPYPGYNEKMILGPTERREVFAQIAALKREGYPVLNTGYALELMGSGRAFRCNIPGRSVQVMADGKIFACEPRVLPDLAPYGSIDTVDLRTLPDREDFRATRDRLRACNRCLLPCVANMADGILSQSLRRAANQFYYRSGRPHPGSTRDWSR